MLHQRMSVPKKRIKETKSIVVTKNGRYTLTYTNKTEETWELIIKEDN